MEQGQKHNPKKAREQSQEASLVAAVGVEAGAALAGALGVQVGGLRADALVDVQAALLAAVVDVADEARAADALEAAERVLALGLAVLPAGASKKPYETPKSCRYSHLLISISHPARLHVSCTKCSI